MRIAIGADHRGVHVKSKVINLLRRLGHESVDFGTDSNTSVDYPDIAALVAVEVAAGRADRGVLICGSGIGMCITANKVNGIRAANCNDDVSAEMSRRHNDVNVLCLSADMLGEQLIDRLVEIWLDTAFDGARHARRVDKIARIEQQQARADTPVPESQSRQ